MRYLVETHAKQCKLQGRLCPVPQCADVKEQSRRSGTAQAAMDARRRAAQNSSAKMESATTSVEGVQIAPSSAPSAATEPGGAETAVSQAQTIAAKVAGRSVSQTIDFSKLRVLSDVDVARYTALEAKVASKIDELVSALSAELQAQFLQTKDLIRKKLCARIRHDSMIPADADVPWDVERQHFFDVQCIHELNKLHARLREEKELETTEKISAENFNNPVVALKTDLPVKGTESVASGNTIDSLSRCAITGIGASSLEDEVDVGQGAVECSDEVAQMSSQPQA